jgi:hypothetical protein
MATDTTTSKELAKPEERGLSRVGQYSLAQVVEQRLWETEQLYKVANVLFNPTVFQAVPPMWKLVLGMVKVNPSEESRETYPIPGSGERGLAKVSIDRIAGEAGISVEDARRLSPLSDINNYEFQTAVIGQMADAKFRRVSATADWHWDIQLDLNRRIGIKKGEKDPDAYAKRLTMQQREKAAETTQTRSMLRAMRVFLSLKTSYTAAEIAKPFLIAKLVPDPDMDDPEVKQAVIQQALGATRALYPTARLPQVLVGELATTVAPELPEDENEAATPSDPHNSEPQAPDAPPPLEEKAPVDAETSEGEPLSLVHPTPAEQRQAEKREIIEDLNASVAGGQLDKATVRDITRDVLGLRNGQATPHLSLLDLPSLRSVRARVREAKARA